jgi:hypothetical protein
MEGDSVWCLQLARQQVRSELPFTVLSIDSVSAVGLAADTVSVVRCGRPCVQGRMDLFNTMFLDPSITNGSDEQAIPYPNFLELPSSPLSSTPKPQ